MNCFAYDDTTLDQILIVGILLGVTFTVLGYMLVPVIKGFWAKRK